MRVQRDEKEPAKETEKEQQLNQKVLRDQVRRELTSGFGDEELVGDFGKSLLFPETGAPAFLARRRLECV